MAVRPVGFNSLGGSTRRPGDRHKQSKGKGAESKVVKNQPGFSTYSAFLIIFTHYFQLVPALQVQFCK